MILRDIDAPRLGERDVLIEVAYSGICGSELSGFLGRSSLRKPPLVFGHEVSGRIHALGAEAGPTYGLRKGQLVTANPLIYCGRCEFCVTGRQQLCCRRLLLGATLPGCNAEYVAVPAFAVLALPDTLDLKDASMAEPAACAVHAVERSAVRPGASALVVGAGPIGLFILQALKLHGVVNLYVAELNPARLRMAVELGAVAVGGDGEDVATSVQRASSDRGVDLAFDAVGSPATRQACLAATRSGGQIIAVGLHSHETALPVNTLVRSELTVIGSFAYTVESFRNALTWLAEMRMGIRDGVVVAPLSDGSSWYQRLIDGDPASKVLLDPTA
jgi:threonine dehydrogenase-like Zn-dependent dehydrogenase